MENVKEQLISTPLLRVLDFLLEHTGIEPTDLEITQKIEGVKRSSVHQSLTRLNQMGITKRIRKDGRFTNSIDYSNQWIPYFKIACNILSISSLVDRIKEISISIILFGSRATGANRDESDFDLFVVANDYSEILKKIEGTPFVDRVQLIVKTPEEKLLMEEKNRVLSDRINKGITLWER